jgi:hypothetical protein
MKCVVTGSLVLALLGCGRPGTTTVGQVQDCDNGTYFSLKTQSCQALWGYEARPDAAGFERLHIVNGITVPRKINGYSPFLVTVAYNVSRPSTLEVVLKRVTDGQVGGDSLSDWQKIEVTEAGAGVREVVLTPSYALPKGQAAAYIDGRWAVDSGYMIEVKGGDRFEDEDADRLGSWRVAGIQVDPDVPRDPAAKALILGAMEAPDAIVGCQLVTVNLPVERLNFDAKFEVSLKKPGSGWDNNGEKSHWVEKGFRGRLAFQFEAVHQESKECASPGPGAYRDDSGQYPPDAYLFQLDVFKDGSEKLDTQSEDYTVPESSQAVIVTSAS